MATSTLLARPCIHPHACAAACHLAASAWARPQKCMLGEHESWLGSGQQLRHYVASCFVLLRLACGRLDAEGREGVGSCERRRNMPRPLHRARCGAHGCRSFGLEGATGCPCYGTPARRRAGVL